mmetsp:Transcript_7526/g.23568  ORF Transcript_7526/g.23568 Transcript_7526/m.23568 type:complete len:320 (-) Transcript_7526:41-1000(-)
MAFAPLGSTPIIFIFGAIVFKYVATPAIKPPPPMGINTALAVGNCRKISTPQVPWPAMTYGSSNGGMNVISSSTDRFFAYAAVSSKFSPMRTTSPPSLRTASTLIFGVVTGIATTALIPNVFALKATPCAWFPALAVIIPLSNSSFFKFLILLYAPRILNEKTCCKSSLFKNIRFCFCASPPGVIGTLAVTLSDNRAASSSGVSTTTSYTSAVKMAFKYHPESCKSSTVVVGALNFDTSPGCNVKSSGLTIGFALTLSLSSSSFVASFCFFSSGLIKVAGALMTSSSLFVSDAKFSRIAFGGSNALSPPRFPPPRPFQE